MLASLRVLQETLDDIAPPYLTLDWDNSGMQVAPEGEEVEKLLVGLDPTLELIKRAVESEADLIVTHHPLFFDPPRQLDPHTPQGEKVSLLLSNGVGLITAHTNMDRSARGLSQALAERIELSSPSPLTSAEEAKLKKITVFVPQGHLTSVRRAAFEAGAGAMGDYDCCSFSTRGRGTFRPLEGSEPYMGEIGEVEEVGEVKLELQVRTNEVDRVVDSILRAHPYEEVAYDTYTTDRVDPEVGLGRIGKWEERSFREALAYLREALGLKDGELTVVEGGESEIGTVAVSPGSGGSLLGAALGAGADLFLTGELDYHERLEAKEAGLSVVQTGHYHSEKVFMPWLRRYLNRHGPSDLAVDIFEEGI